MITSGHIPVNGARIYFEATGDPSMPALLFIHAGVADQRMWDAQVEYFAPRYRVVRYDTRGYGQTMMKDVEFTNHADATAVLDHLRIAKAVLIGCSRGGGIAIDFTLEHPQQVLALVVVGSGPGGFQYKRPDNEVGKFIGSLSDQMDTAWKARDFERLAALDVRLWGDGPSAPEGRMARPMREKMYGMCLDTYRHWTTNGKPIELQPPAYERLSEIKAPTLIVDGDLDLPSIAVMAEAMQGAITHAQRLTIRNAAHLTPMEQPDVFNAALENFLRQNHT